MFEISIVLFFYILPVISIAVDFIVFHEMTIFQVILKWCVFWGDRSLAFTAKTIFEVTDTKAFPIVRKLGFANICTVFIGTISLFFPNFRLTAAIIGTMYFFLALFRHLFRKKKNATEMFVTITDLSIALELAVPLCVTEF